MKSDPKHSSSAKRPAVDPKKRAAMVQAMMQQAAMQQPPAGAPMQGGPPQGSFSGLVGR